MVIYYAKEDPKYQFFDEIAFRNLAIKISNESIENIRKELDKRKD
ncbi:hypothetical protein [Methanobrevibacter millerae]|jgi:hypothetical protein|uniref:Uncharacterized protein n=1 Tax=Methanobrevibacter millerae TaxID=230361 RepID=A0A1G5WX97_9EURY|nr:hypothetical protein [Methanobrevibacter millerae]SDA62753.1 hypothetical protein SAMN02910315_01779 [Methanobrevibacter millerae]